MMHRRTTYYRMALVLIGGLLIFALAVGCGGQVTDEPTVEPTEEPTPAPTEEDPVAVLAAKILNGEIDVGSDYSMLPGARYHNIHSETLEIECTTCHTAHLSSEETVFFDQNRSPSAPGPVDRSICLECHETGPASQLYQLGSH